MNIFLLIGAVLILFLIICLFNYNSLVKFANFIAEAWSGINVQLGTSASLGGLKVTLCWPSDSI